MSKSFGYPNPFARLHFVRVFIPVFFFLCSLIGFQVRATEIQLAWEPGMEAEAAGYIIYYGYQSRQYDFAVDVGKQARYTVTHLEGDGPYYFAVTAYNAEGLESGFSNEAVYVRSAIDGDRIPLYFPFVVAFEGNETRFGLINTSHYREADGTLIAYDGNGREIFREERFLAPRQKLEISLNELSPGFTGTGYLVYESAHRDLIGYTEHLEQGNSKVIVPGLTEVPAGDIYIPFIRSTPDWWTFIVLLNTSSTHKDLDIRFDNGTWISLSLPVQTQAVFSIRDLFDSRYQSGIHWAHIANSDGVIGLQFIGNGTQTGGFPLEPATRKEMYLPLVTGDPNGWSALVVLNPSDLPGFFRIKPYASDGRALSALDFLLLEGTVLEDMTENMDLPEETAWLKVEGTHPFTGFGALGTVDDMRWTPVFGFPAGLREAILPRLSFEEKNGIILVNTSDRPASVRLSAHNHMGDTLTIDWVDLPAYGQSVRQPPDLGTKASYLSYTSEEKVIGIQLMRSQKGGIRPDALPGR